MEDPPRKNLAAIKAETSPRERGRPRRHAVPDRVNRRGRAGGAVAASHRRVADKRPPDRQAARPGAGEPAAGETPAGPAAVAAVAIGRPDVPRCRRRASARRGTTRLGNGPATGSPQVGPSGRRSPPVRLPPPARRLPGCRLPGSRSGGPTIRFSLLPRRLRYARGSRRAPAARSTECRVAGGRLVADLVSTLIAGFARRIFHYSSCRWRASRYRYRRGRARNAMTPASRAGVIFERTGGDLLSQGVSPQVPSARAVFTAVFGMGTGVSPPPWPPEHLSVLGVLSEDSIASTNICDT